MLVDCHLVQPGAKFCFAVRAAYDAMLGLVQVIDKNFARCKKPQATLVWALKHNLSPAIQVNAKQRDLRPFVDQGRQQPISLIHKDFKHWTRCEVAYQSILVTNGCVGLYSFQSVFTQDINGELVWTAATTRKSASSDVYVLYHFRPICGNC